MKATEIRLPQEFDKSFIVYKEIGKFFPVPWHFHPEFELVLVLSSTGKRIVGDNIGHFEPGDLVFMGSCLPHVWVNDAKYVEGKVEKPAEAIVIQFREEFLGEKFLKLPEVHEFRKFLVKSSRGVVIEGKTRQNVIKIMRQIDEMSGLQRLSSLFLIFDILSKSTEISFLTSPGFMETFEPKLSDRFMKVTNYILENFRNDISLSDVAAAANMATTTFCVFFKKYYRMPYVQYLNKVRIGNACKLLTEKDYTISDIAYQCGFKNIANFNRQFKKDKGLTPREFRSSLLDTNFARLKADIL